MFLDLPKASPALGQAAYDLWMKKLLQSSEIKRSNYARLRDGVREAQLTYGPIKLDVEPVSRCNFRCTMCVVSEWSKGQRSHDMTLKTFRELIDSQPQLLEIKIQGLGEPTLLGDDLFAMIRYAIEKGLWVRTTTNASLLHRNFNYKKLIDSGVCEVQVSVDGASSNIFNEIRVGSHPERVFENCKLLNSYCDEVNRHVTKMWTVVQEKNCGELEDLVELACSLGFGSLVFSLDLTGWGEKKWQEINGAKEQKHKLDSARLRGLVAIGEKLGVRVEFWTINDKYSAEHLETLCPWPFERAMVSSDSRTVPCCMISNPDVFELGKGLDFASAWHGRQYEQFRKAHLSGEIPRVCQSCYK